MHWELCIFVFVIVYLFCEFTFVYLYLCTCPCEFVFVFFYSCMCLLDGLPVAKSRKAEIVGEAENPTTKCILSPQLLASVLWESQSRIIWPGKSLRWRIAFNPNHASPALWCGNPDNQARNLDSSESL